MKYVRAMDYILCKICMRGTIREINFLTNFKERTSSTYPVYTFVSLSAPFPPRPTTREPLEILRDIETFCNLSNMFFVHSLQIKARSCIFYACVWFFISYIPSPAPSVENEFSISDNFPLILCSSISLRSTCSPMSLCQPSFTYLYIASLSHGQIFLLLLHFCSLLPPDLLVYFYFHFFSPLSINPLQYCSLSVFYQHYLNYSPLIMSISSTHSVLPSCLNYSLTSD